MVKLSKLKLQSFVLKSLHEILSKIRTPAVCVVIVANRHKTRKEASKQRKKNNKNKVFI